MSYHDLEERIQQSLQRWHDGRVVAVPGNKWASVLGLKKSEFSGAPKDAFELGGHFERASLENTDAPRKWVYGLALRVDLYDADEEDLQGFLKNLCRMMVLSFDESPLNATLCNPFPRFHSSR